jgi:hypothetical protein
VARVLTGPARCIECGAVWRAVHLVSSSGEDCLRCGGLLELVEPLEPWRRPPGVEAGFEPRFAHADADRQTAERRLHENP